MGKEALLLIETTLGRFLLYTQNVSVSANYLGFNTLNFQSSRSGTPKSPEKIVQRII
jgi:hypothetical protein